MHPLHTRSWGVRGVCASDDPDIVIHECYCASVPGYLQFGEDDQVAGVDLVDAGELRGGVTSALFDAACEEDLGGGDLANAGIARDSVSEGLFFGVHVGDEVAVYAFFLGGAVVNDVSCLWI